jgi:DNA-binding response OmpR family regulator
VLVDDNEALREAFSLVISSRGYDVYTFGDIESCVVHLSAGAQSVGLIFLELDLAHNAAYEFLAERARNPDLLGVPVVALTALAERQIGALLHVEKVLYKPARTDVLLATIRQHCGTPATGASVGVQQGTGRPRKVSGVRLVRGIDFDAWQKERTQNRKRSSDGEE